MNIKLTLQMFMIAFLVGSQITGLTQQCIYESPYGLHSITIKNYQLCPTTIDV